MRVPIKGYEKYEVSDEGIIYNAKGQALVGFNVQGYRHILLYKDGKPKQFSIHRLVASAFIPNPDNLPCVNHKDEDKANNRLDNLEWCDYSYNNRYGTGLARRTESGKQVALRNNRCKEVICLKDGKRFYSVRDAGKYYGISPALVSRACIEKYANSKYQFRFCSECAD